MTEGDDDDDDSDDYRDLLPESALEQQRIETERQPSLFRDTEDAEE